jgi:hypothetical protein
VLAKLERFCQIPPDERRLLIRATAALSLVGLSLRMNGFRRTFEQMERFSNRTDDALPIDAMAESRKATQAVDRAAYNIPLYRPTCLPQSLVLWYLLRRRGLPAELRIGVRKAAGDFTAHAWVEHAGQVVNDDPDVAQRFTPVDLPASLTGARW